MRRGKDTSVFKNLVDDFNSPSWSMGLGRARVEIGGEARIALLQRLYDSKINKMNIMIEVDKLNKII